MFTLVLGKIKNKKVMNLCLMLGIVMFILVAAATPMFESGSLRKLLQTKFDDYLRDNNEYPFVLSRSESLEANGGFDSTLVENVAEEYIQLWKKYLNVNEAGRLVILSLPDGTYKREVSSDSGHAGIEFISDLDKNITIVAGEDATVKSYDSSGNVFECIVSEQVYDDENLTLGEIITFPNYHDSLSNTLKLKVAGIYKNNDNTVYGNLRNTKNLKSKFLVGQSQFNKLCQSNNVSGISFSIYLALDYFSLKCEDVDSVVKALNSYIEEDELFSTNVMPILAGYIKSRTEVKTMSMVLQFPVFVLLLFFIYMVTGQLIGSESGEIAIMKSRGFTSLKITMVYLWQSLVIGLASLLIALPLSYELCHMVACADGFMVFSSKNLDEYTFDPMMIPYALVAFTISVIVILIPTIKYSFKNVVNAKEDSIFKMKKSFIYKFYLDVLLAIVFIYLAFNYRRQKDLLADSIIRGEGIDVMMFLSAALLSLSFALLTIRVIGYIVKIVYRIGKKYWSPGMYASFLELIRNSRKRDFISIFIVFAVAMSIFEANLASTVNTNNVLRINYDDGADVVIKERWIPERRVEPDTHKTIRYYVEPDYGRFNPLIEEGVKMTRVINADAFVVLNKTVNADTKLMAINTKEFGKIAQDIAFMNGEHWYKLLNALATNRDGVLISQTIADANNIKVGDRFTYARKNELEDKKSEEPKEKRTVTVVGIFDSFPGYEKYRYEYDQNMMLNESLNNLIVTNYAGEINSFGISPYEIWMNTDNAYEKMKDEDKALKIYDFIKNSGIITTHEHSIAGDVKAKKSESMILVTNGLFSLGFIVSVITCMLGMLIYWITSFREREMIFCVYRAMGMTRRSVSGIIINEQIFASVLAWAFGGITGVLQSLLLVELLASVYLPYKHNIVLSLVPDYKDMIMLMIVIFAVIMLCITILKRLMKHSNMVRAIKMGE